MTQHEHDDTELYRALRCKFEMTPEQMQRLEKKIRQRTAEKPYSRMITVKRYAKRIVPLAACIALICAAGFKLRTKLPQPEYTQTSNAEVEVAVQTLPAADDSSAAKDGGTKPVTTAAVTDGYSRTETVPAVTTAAETDAQPMTETAVQTDAPDVQDDTQELEIVKEPVVTTAEETTHTTVTETQTTPETVTETDPETQAPETTETTAVTDAPQTVFYLVLPDVTAHAGEQITVSAYLTGDANCAGLQFYAQIVSDDENVPMPQIESISSDINAQVRADLVFLNYDAQWATVVYGNVRNTLLPEGTAILTMTINIPEDAASGTVYRFSQENEKNRVVDANGQNLPIEFEYGSIIIE